jgi:hypothetical protein
VWETQRHQNTPLHERIVSQVTIIDPAHPLYGHTFSLASSSTTRGNTPTLMIPLPNGQQRSVPRAVTDLAPPLSPAEDVAPALPRISVRILLPLAQQVRRLRQATEERLHATCTPLPSPQGTLALIRHDPAAAVAPADAGTPTAERAVRRPTTAASPASPWAPGSAGGQ